jgi:hypothetical protein
MNKGRRLEKTRPLKDIKEEFQREFERLDDRYKALHNPEAFPVSLSSGLEELQKKVIHRVMEKELGES